MTRHSQTEESIAQCREEDAETPKPSQREVLSTYKQELEELIEKLRNGEVRVIITGEPLNKDKSFVVHLYTENLAIVVDRVAGSRGITISISLTGLRGTHVITPRLLGDGKLKTMQCGLILTDGSIKNGYPVMPTTQLWQAIAWLIAWPGKNHVYISGVSLNDSSINITWQLRAIDYKGVFKGKADVVKETGRLGEEEFPTFVVYIVFGDGEVNVKRKDFRLTMGKSKLGLWGSIIEKLKGLGFRKGDDYGYAVAYVVRFSKAVELARKILSDTMIKALIEGLAQLPDAEKLRRLIELASMELKPLGHSSIEVVDGIRMNVHVSNSGTIELRAWRKGLEDAVRIRERLKRAGYEARLRPSSSDFEVYIGMYVIERDQELARKVCEVLRRMHEEAASKGKERRARAIARAMKKLGCPAQGPRAQTNKTQSTINPRGAPAGI